MAVEAGKKATTNEIYFLQALVSSSFCGHIFSTVQTALTELKGTSCLSCASVPCISLAIIFIFSYTNILTLILLVSNDSFVSIHGISFGVIHGTLSLSLKIS